MIPLLAQAETMLDSAQALADAQTLQQFQQALIAFLLLVLILGVAWIVRTILPAHKAELAALIKSQAEEKASVRVHYEAQLSAQRSAYTAEVEAVRAELKEVMAWLRDQISGRTSGTGEVR